MRIESCFMYEDIFDMPHVDKCRRPLTYFYFFWSRKHMKESSSLLLLDYRFTELSQNSLVTSVLYSAVSHHLRGLLPDLAIPSHAFTLCRYPAGRTPKGLRPNVFKPPQQFSPAESRRLASAKLKWALCGTLEQRNSRRRSTLPIRGKMPAPGCRRSPILNGSRTVEPTTLVSSKLRHQFLNGSDRGLLVVIS
jgi:hypothetical protein